MSKRDFPTVAELEEAAVRKAVTQYDTRQEAADALGISVRTLYRRMDQYGLRDTNLGFGGPDAGDTGGLLGEVLDD